MLLGSPLHSGRFIIATSMVNTSSHTEEISQSTGKTYWHPTWISLVKVVLLLRLWCLQWARDLCGASWVWRLKDEGKAAPFIPSLHGLWWAWCHLASPRADALPTLNCGCCQCTSGTWCLQSNKKMSRYLEEATNWYGGQAVSTQASRRKHCRSQLTHLAPPGV